MKKLLLALVTWLFFLLNAGGQADNQVSHSISDYFQMVKNGEKQIDNSNWKDACTQWEIITSLNPTVGEFWYKLGQSYYYNAQPDKAIESFKNCKRVGASSPYEPFDCAYFIARCYAKKSDKNNTLDWLQKAFDLGYRNIMSVPRDSSFSSYFNEPRFMHIVGIPLKEFKTREEGWRFDLWLAVREIKRRSPDPYRKVSEKQFDSAVQLLHDKIPSLTDIQIITELMKIMTLAWDGHTMIYGFYERPEFLQNLPLEFYKFDEGIFITGADKRYEDLLGCRVTAFDEKPVTDILRGMEPILNRDNEQGPTVLGLMRIRTLPILYGLGLIKKPGEVSITVKSPDEKLRKVTIKADCPVASRKLWDKLPENWTTYHQKNGIKEPLYMRNKYTHYWFNYFPAEKTLYFQYNAIVDDPGNSFYKFSDSLFDFIENSNTEKLIIDLRWNNGGNTLMTPYFLNKVIACKKINERGKLFGIIGRRTYSAAINLCGYLERFTRITYVGEPTGSSPNFIGEDRAFELPFSKLMANVSDRYWQSSWPDNRSQWFSPLVYVTPAFGDFAAGKDPALDLILEYSQLSK